MGGGTTGEGDDAVHMVCLDKLMGQRLSHQSGGSDDNGCVFHGSFPFNVESIGIRPGLPCPDYSSIEERPHLVKKNYLT